MHRLATLLAYALLTISAGEDPRPPLGDPGFQPSPQRPVGWLGDFTGRYPGAADFPLEWDTTTGQNILWKAQLPAGGHSSPIVVGKRVFLTCERGQTVALDADTGAILWQRSEGSLRSGKSGIYHDATGYSMGTVCSDGAAVYVTHYNGVVASYSLDGTPRWRKDVAPLGWSGASPVLVDGKFVVLQGTGKDPNAKIQLHGPYDLVAYACADGTEVWKSTSVVRMSGWHYNGLVPMRIAGRAYLVNYLGQFFDLRDGWLVAQLFQEGTTSNPLAWVPAVQGDTVVFALEQYRSADRWRLGLKDLASVALPEALGLEESRRRDWSIMLNNGKVPRGAWYSFHALHDTVVLAVQVADDGKGGLRFTVAHRPSTFFSHACDVATLNLADGLVVHRGDGNHTKPGLAVFDLISGVFLTPGGSDGMEVVPDHPVPDPLFSGSGMLYAHPVIADGYLSVSDWNGRTHVYQLRPEFREVAVNLTRHAQKPPAGNPISGPAGGLESSEYYYGNRIFFRHWDALYCIGDPQATEHAAAFAVARGHAQAGRTAEARHAYAALLAAKPLHVRLRSVRELAGLGSAAAEELCQALRHADAHTRALVIALLATLPGADVTDRLVAALSDADATARRAVVETLGRRHDRRAAPSLAGALRDADAEVRLAAITALGGSGDAAGVRILLDLWPKLDASARAAGSKALAAIQDPEVDQILARLPEDAETRSAALLALGARRATAHADVVVRELAHPTASVRSAAATALGALAGMEVVAHMADRILQATDDDERTCLERSLIAIQSRFPSDARYATTLLARLDRAQGAGRATLLRALGPAGGAATLAAVKSALHQDDPLVVRGGLAALTQWPDATAETLLKSFKTEDTAAATLLACGLRRMAELPPGRPAPEKAALYAAAVATRQDLPVTIAAVEAFADHRAIVVLKPLLADKVLAPTVVEAMQSCAPLAARSDATKTVEALEAAAFEVVDGKLRSELGKTISTLRKTYNLTTKSTPCL